ncbi:MAG: hypothetical protein ACLP7I_12005 [Limisphaerales bacterium]
MKNGKNDARQKLKAFHKRKNAAASSLRQAREHLVEAFSLDDDLEKFKVQLQGGHVMTLDDLHAWLIAVIEDYEKNGPRAEALNVVNDYLKTQFPARQ